MSIIIEKRTRATVDDSWSDWVVTSDTAPYENTDIVQYRVQSSVSISTVTNASEIGNGTGTFDVLMQAIDRWLDYQFDLGRFTAKEYAFLLSNGMQLAMTQATQWARAETLTNLQIDKARCDTQVACDTATVSASTIEDKIEMSEVQLGKLTADRDYVLSQRDALDKSVIDNRKIKAIDSLADTYGTFGAGGLTLSTDMWSTFYKLIASLTNNLNDYKGEWDAGTNTPDVSAVADPKAGDYYVVSVAGTTNLDGNTSWAIGDIAVYVGDRYIKSDVTVPTSTTVTKVT